jgi:hypothetical protein
MKMPIIRLIRQAEEIHSNLIGQYDHIVIDIHNKPNEEINKKCGIVFARLSMFGEEYAFDYFPTEEGGYLDCKRIS